MNVIPTHRRHDDDEEEDDDVESIGAQQSS